MASFTYLSSRRCWQVRWRAVCRSTGSVFAGSRCCHDKPSAAKLWADMVHRENAFRTGNEAGPDSVTDLAMEFARYCRRHAPRTQELYRRVMKRFLTHVSQIRSVRDLQPAHIEKYLAALADSGCSNRTQNSHLTAIKALCRFISRRLHVPNAAAEVGMLTEDPPNSRWLTAEEYALLLAKADPVNRDRMVFLANTGLRASEFAQLVQGNRLTRTSTAVTVIGKGRRRRTVPLNAACRTVLARGLMLKPCGRNALFQAFSKIAKGTGVPSIGPHALRHWFATRMLIKGVPIAIVAKLLGHSVRVCETTYAHILPQDVAQSTAVLDENAPSL